MSRARLRLLLAAQFSIALSPAALLPAAGKYLLMSPSLDRSGTVGFRCAQDVR
ncbi:MAG: hypothetical protein WA510_00880 [Acidobacteriaceae bacterium]